MEILCRVDASTVPPTPVVFLRDTINKNQIQVWKGEGNPVYVPLDYYKMTGPLSAQDEKALMERYKLATGKQDQIIKINHRLPRNERPLPNLLATTPPAAVKAPVDTTALSSLSAEQIAALTAAGVVLPPIFPAAPQAAPAPAKQGRKVGRRKSGRAKPIEKQQPSVAQATPADVMAAIQALGQEFNTKLAGLMTALAPATK